MTRVSTLGSYQSALLNLFAAQQRQQDAQQRLSTEKIATDLVGFGRASETLTGLTGAQNRIQGFVDTGEAVLARLDTQDLAMNRVNDAIGAARAAIGGVLASDSAIVLNLELDNAFQSVRGGLNASHQGAFVFGGGNSGVAPVAYESLTDLAAGSVADAFRNGPLKQSSRVSETTTVETGYLAKDLGEDIFQILSEIRNFNDTNVDGPLTGKPTEAQKSFLSDMLGRLDAASGKVVDQISRNGAVYNQVESLIESNSGQVASLTNMLAERTDADLAQAATDITLSQFAVQASAQVINQLRQVSLLNYLS